jgi:hypothetical protein
MKNNKGKTGFLKCLFENMPDKHAKKSLAIRNTVLNTTTIVRHNLDLTN